MSKHFDYNFTRQSQFQQLKERNMELEQQNDVLKQSLEELIKVNTELTESIEELNNNGGGFNQQNQELQTRLEMVMNQNHNLRQMLEHQNEIQKERESFKMTEDQTEGLVSVLEELIVSFKNIQGKYQSKIEELQALIAEKAQQNQQKLTKISQDLQSRINTIQALSLQLKRKDEALEQISAKIAQIEKEGRQQKKFGQGASNSDNSKKLEKQLETINKQLEEKDQVINYYEKLLQALKKKIMQKI